MWLEIEMPENDVPTKEQFEQFVRAARQELGSEAGLEPWVEWLCAAIEALSQEAEIK